MKNFYDVQQFLKSFGTIIYIGERDAEISLMMMELDELYEGGIIEQRVYDTAKIILTHELKNSTN
ncbi:YqgQ family protein [Exiguobacterium sp. s131]|uniref:YqgQ family protein n=1 Tax=Exiguobacterium sp. s131 TaxID=2751278 RepID=UPI001BEA0B49|nr:YqgQ family protein [Exiguobacterium sp. s131]